MLELVILVLDTNWTINPSALSPQESIGRMRSVVKTAFHLELLFVDEASRKIM